MPYVDYKKLREINAFDYLIRFENCEASAKSNKSWLLSSSPSGTGVLHHNPSGQTFLVKTDAKDASEFRITAADGTAIPTGKGTASTFDLLSLVAYLHNTNDFQQAAIAMSAVLPELTSGVATPHTTYVKPAVVLDTKELTKKILSHIQPLTDISYLEKRNINAAIIHDDIMFGRIAQYKATPTHANLCFNCYDSNDQFVTTCQRYYSGEKALKMFPCFTDKETKNKLSPSTTGTIFRSNMPDVASPILLFSESPEDALSYYQLHNDLLKDKTFIASSLGTFRKDQAQLLTQICQDNKIERIVLANDNDAAGINFDVMALCAITPYTTNESPFFHASCTKPKAAENSNASAQKLNFHLEFNRGFFPFAKRLYDLLEKNIFTNPSRLGKSDGLMRDDTIEKLVLDFECKNDRTHSEDIFCAIFKADDSGYFDKHFLVDKPKDMVKVGEDKKSEIKDWNECLANYQGGDIIQDFETKQFFDDDFVKEDVEKKKCVTM